MIISSNLQINSNFANTAAVKSSAEQAPKNEEANSDKVSIGEREPQQQSADAEALARKIVGKRGNPSEVTVLKGTKGDDVIRISRGESGGIKININGEEASYTSSQAEKLVIDAQAGNDIIIADKDVRTPLFITGGLGNDKIIGGSGNDTIIDSFGQNIIEGRDGNDAIIASGLDLDASSPAVKTIGGRAVNGSILIGGRGNDYIEGGKAGDLLIGGKGNDSLYGLNGDDIILAGDGRDYADGGRGSDIIRASGNKNVLFGGQGDDFLRLNGNGLIADSFGSNTIESSGTGLHVISTDSSTVNVPEGAKKEILEPIQVPSSFKISGSESFKDRVSSDLDSLASIQIGQKMLSEIDKTGNSVSITETPGGNQCSSGSSGYLDDDHRTPREGSSSTIYYNRSTIALNGDSKWKERPALVGLYHEMAHSYNAATGTMDNWAYEYDGRPATGPYGVVGAEFQAVGLDNRYVKPNPEGLTENAMRDLMGLEKRERY